MSDPVVVQVPVGTTPVLVVPPVKDGKLTTEYFFTKVVVYGGMLLGVLGAASQFLSLFSTMLPTNPYVNLGLAVVGALMAGIKGAVYDVERSSLKKNAQDNAVIVTPTLPTGDAAAAVLNAS